MKIEAVDCVSCGAPLQPEPGVSVVECSYCGRTLRVHGQRTELSGPAPGPALADELLQGYSREAGIAWRRPLSEMLARDWQATDYTVWPDGADASSTYGRGWSPEAICGPPAVFPRHGDRAGAWAPRARTSHTEWIEARYPAGPPIRTVRLFETNAPGSTFAVTGRTDPDGDELMLWQGAPQQVGEGAAVLEVEVEPPRPLRAVRAYVVNQSGRWTQIDTIGLVADDPIPEPLRRAPRPPPPRPRVNVVGMILSILALGAAVALAAVFLLRGDDPEPLPDAPTEEVAGSRAVARMPPAARLIRRPTIWASRVLGGSSQYSEPGWSFEQALGSPNVYPTHADKKAAWASKGTDAGDEWIELGFAQPVTARAVVVVETYNPGAVVRIDDVTPGRPSRILWRGRVAAQPGLSRVLEVELAEPLSIGAVRLVLDSAGVAGWNEIDAVGLVVSKGLTRD